MKPETILWIYIVLLVLGGLIGFLKAKSKISLITSVAFAIVLGICAAAAGYLPPVAGAIAQEVIDVAAVLNAVRVALPFEDLTDF